MSTVLSLGGWAVSLVLCAALLRLRRRLDLVALACHELRGPATAIGLAAAALRREPGGPSRALPFEAQLERMRAGLADLEAARCGRRARPCAATVSLERLLEGAAAGWRPVVAAEGRGVCVSSELGAAAVRADRGRLSQALGNLLANASEHGSGTVELRGRRSGDRVLVEVRDEGASARRGRSGPERSKGRERAAGPDRGLGLAIATAAVEEAGGRLTLRRQTGATVAALELPVVER